MLSRPIPQPKPSSRVAEKRDKRRTQAQQEQDFRNAVWARDGWQCRHCQRKVKRGSPSMLERGEVHHLEPRSRSKAKKFDVANGCVLCVECHGKAQRHKITLEAR